MPGRVFYFSGPAVVERYKQNNSKRWDSMAEKSEAKLGKKNQCCSTGSPCCSGFREHLKELNGHEMMFDPEASLLIRELFDIYVDVSWQFIEDQCFASPCVLIQPFHRIPVVILGEKTVGCCEVNGAASFSRQLHGSLCETAW